MNRNDCEAVLYFHRMFRPRRRTGRGFLTGTVFLDAAVLVAAFVLATSPLVRKPGVSIDLPAAVHTTGILFNEMVLTVSDKGIMFFNDEPVALARLETELADALRKRPEATLILEADPALTQTTLIAIYDAAAAAGFEKVFIATRRAEPPNIVP